MNRLIAWKTIILIVINALSAILFYVPFTVIAFKYGIIAFVIYLAAIFFVCLLGYIFVEWISNIKRKKT